MEFLKILVPVSGNKADKETIELACRLAKPSKGNIYIVYVIAIKRALPLEAEINSEIKKAEAILDQAESVAEDQDYEVETDLIQARNAAPAIVDEAIDRKVDLILLGDIYKWRFGQFSLGNVVPYVLKNAPCRVILYHQLPK
ncbi:universal stress protein [Chloroflexota bacterium]